MNHPDDNLRRPRRLNFTGDTRRSAGVFDVRDVTKPVMKSLILASLAVALAVVLPACSSDDPVTTTTTTTEETVRPATTGVTQTTVTRSY